MPSKPLVHQTCLAQLQAKIANLEARIQDAQQAASEDTKSSAGDKFETSREMMKQEIEKASQQLALSHRMQEVLHQLKPDQPLEQVGLGSLVKSNEGWYYFSVSLGSLSVEGQTVYALSMASPLGKALQGKAAGDRETFRGREVHIERVA